MNICKIGWRHPARYLLPAAFATALMAPMAQAAVIDFNALAGTGLVDRGITYSEDGFVLDNLSSTDPFAFGSIHSPDLRFTGTVSFFNGIVGGITRLTQSGGGAFDLVSIDLDSFNPSEATEIDFTGTLADSSTVTQSFTTDAMLTVLQSFSFGAAFDNVVRVEWAQIIPLHSFDNITVNPVIASSDVPEPMTLSLLGAGLAGVAWSRRRQVAKA